MKWVNIWTNRPYALFIMHLSAKATVSRFNKHFPASSITRGGSYWENGWENYFYVEEEVSQTVDALARKTLADPAFVYGFLKPALEKARELNELSKKFLAASWLEKPSNELADYVKEFGELWCDMYSYGTVPTLIGYREDNALYARMNDVLRKKTANAPGKFAKSLLALTRPLKRLKTQEQELRVLKIAAEARQRSLKTREEVAAAFSRELNALFEEFKWLSFDLCNSVAWDLNHYVGLVMEKLLSKELEKEIEFNENYEEKAVGDFELACRELPLNEEERGIFKVVGDIGYFKWAREYEFLQGFYNTKFVQDELGKRIGLTSLESKYVLCDEWLNALKKPVEFKQKARERVKNCLIIVHKDESVLLLEGDSAKTEYSKMDFVKEEVDTKARELRGTSACTGTARGKVSIVNDLGDASKMMEGDVLVSVATNPDLVPAMKKAIAIVTSEGGITCHAAIVARELRIPCVVGVKNVCKILKDGDFVEVDAMHGIVRKI